MKRSAQIVQFLFGCTLMFTACNSYNPNMSLVEAVETDNEKLVRYLIKNGRSVLAKDKKRDDLTPFEAACVHGNPSIMKLFLKTAGASIPNDNLNVCLGEASERGHEEIAKHLIREFQHRGMNSAVDQLYLDFALDKASSKGYTKLARTLIESGANINSAGFPLQAASKNGHIDTVELLLLNGADVNKIDYKKGENALITAIKYGHKEIVDILLNAGAKIDIKSDEGITALIVASQTGQSDVVLKLLQSGADITQKDDQGRTAWWFAIMGGDAQTVKVFLDTKKLETQKKEAGLTAASSKGYQNIVKILLDEGVNVNTPTLNGWTPLSVACEENKIEIVKMLIQAGANVNLKGENGRTPLQIAKENGCAEIEAVLLQAGAK